MLISALGTVIYLSYALVGRAGKLTALEGYPRWYQKIVIETAAKKAVQDQIQIIEMATAK